MLSRYFFVFLNKETIFLVFFQKAGVCAAVFIENDKVRRHRRKEGGEKTPPSHFSKAASIIGRRRLIYARICKIISFCV